jgi:hypothetical protein
VAWLIPVSDIFDTNSSKRNKYPEEGDDDDEGNLDGREIALNFDGAKESHWNQHRTKSTPFFFVTQL